MRPTRGCKKPRLQGSSDDEDEAERKKLRVQKLPCYQGEGSLVIQTKKSVEEEKGRLEEKQRQLVEEKNQLKEEMDKVEKMMIGVEAVKAKVEEDQIKVEQEKVKVEEAKVKVEQEKAKVEQERAEVEQEKAKVEQARLVVEEDRLKVEEERVKIEKMSKELQSQVECPVCLSMPREDKPVPCCPQGHFVCSTCRDDSIRQGRLDCPTCRVPMGQGQSLLALTVIKNVQHECGHQGCNVKLNFDEVKEHEEKCTWRLIPCPGMGLFCKANTPVGNVLNHARVCPNCQWPPKQVDGEGALFRNLFVAQRMGNQEILRWTTKILESEEGWFFFVKSTRKGGRYEVDVLMKGSQEDCEKFMVEASILNAETEKPEFKSSFKPRPLTDQNEAIYCLSVPEEGLSRAWKYGQDEGKYIILCSVKIVKFD